MVLMPLMVLDIVSQLIFLAFLCVVIIDGSATDLLCFIVTDGFCNWCIVFQRTCGGAVILAG